jgi:hypothetical protein
MNEFVKMITKNSIPTEFGKSNVLSKLNSITKTQNLITDFEELKYEYEMLNQSYNILKNQNEMLVKENENLQNNSKVYSNEVTELKQKLKILSLTPSSTSGLPSTGIKPILPDNLKLLEKDLEATKTKLDQQIEEYQKLLKEYDVKLSESTQFQQMKKLLHDKNKLITELKNKLAQFEEK